jgi:hypothetical protein
MDFFYLKSTVWQMKDACSGNFRDKPGVSCAPARKSSPENPGSKLHLVPVRKDLIRFAPLPAVNRIQTGPDRLNPLNRIPRCRPVNHESNM